MNRATFLPLAIALAVAIAGYTLQGSPGLPGRPMLPQARVTGPADQAMVEQRLRFGGGAAMQDKLLAPADAFARHGEYADAAEVLRTAVAQRPANAEAWLALANALVGHADGKLTPAADFAFGKALALVPASPAPRYFQAVALIRSGQGAAGQAELRQLLVACSPQAQWCNDVRDQLGQTGTTPQR